MLMLFSLLLTSPPASDLITLSKTLLYVPPLLQMNFISTEVRYRLWESEQIGYEPVKRDTSYDKSGRFEYQPYLSKPA